METSTFERSPVLSPGSAAQGDAAYARRGRVGVRPLVWRVCIAALLAVALMCCGKRAVSHCPLTDLDVVALTLLGADHSGRRADLVYQVFLGPHAGRVAVVQLPRDSRIRMEGRTRKLNAGLGLGVQEMCALVEELSGVGAHRYLLLELDTAVDVVRALAPGGVRVDLPAAVDIGFSSSEGGHRLRLPAGESVVSPDDFVYLCRLRQSADDLSKRDGDVAARLSRQASLLRSLGAQVVRDHDVRLPLRMRDVSRRLTTDITGREWIALARRFRRLQADDLRIVPAPGSPGGGGMWHLDRAQLALVSASLCRWVAGDPRVMVTLRGAVGTDEYERVAAVVQDIADEIALHTEPEIAALPHSWVAYSNGFSSDETRRNRRVAVTISRHMGLPPPHRAMGTTGVTVALSRDCPTAKTRR